MHMNAEYYFQRFQKRWRKKWTLQMLNYTVTTCRLIQLSYICKLKTMQNLTNCFVGLFLLSFLSIPTHFNLPCFALRIQGTKHMRQIEVKFHVKATCVAYELHCISLLGQIDMQFTLVEHENPLKKWTLRDGWTRRYLTWFSHASRMNVMSKSKEKHVNLPCWFSE